ncbi:alpha,alpha-trehalase [Horticoccus luteus]|uniref:Alpha,alpha-trehalase n=1 Tax=Horticoccus luteus TaxID=2862869 RepID=A0A8F9TUD5_9BACT|nr:trehalase family glycosidase [Horticoccus luteus]QYM78463.1 alpha,alpha-trehalase [Horticoccus luteus]
MNLSAAIATTRSYIDANWEKTFRDSRAESVREFPLPRPHTVPSTDPTMWLFFYWDTYFTNLGLLRQGRAAQALNNAENVLHCIEQLGFVPNISVRIALNRSQVPVSAPLFADIYRHTQDRAFLPRAYAALVKEYAFWMALRTAPNGLATCGTHADPVTLADFYKVISHRLRDIPEEPAARLVYLKHKMAECEVWDFNPRFSQRAADFNPVDTNGVLFLFETIAGDFAHDLGLSSDEQLWRDRASHRRALVDRYLWNEQRGYYFDYDWANQRPGSVVSAAPYFALWSGICSDAQAAALVRNLPLVERAHGLITCAEGSNTSANTYQWDAPNAWPPIQTAALLGLLRYGYVAEAKRLAEKYVLTCARNLEQTGQLWEKYNALTGGIDVADEYKMPPMMGWTAGGFLHAAEVLER